MICLKCDEIAEEGSLYCRTHRKETGICPYCGLTLTEKVVSLPFNILMVCTEKGCVHCEDKIK